MFDRRENKLATHIALMLGIGLAIAGSLAVIGTGTAFSNVLGFGTLGLCALAILAYLRRSFPGTGDPGADKEREVTETPDAGAVLKVADILLIEIAPMGRIRSVAGCHALGPELVPGRVAAEVFQDAGIDWMRPGVIETEIGLASVRWKSQSGSTLCIISKNIEAVGQATIEEAVAERTQFFAGLGHDLKSPLNAIIGFSDIMSTRLHGPLPKAYEDYPELIRQGGENLLRLVEDMLDAAKAESGKLELDLAPLDLASSAESAVRQARAITDREKVRLVLRQGPEVLTRADARAIHRILDNLISNAIKYSSQGDEVRVDVWADETQALLRVSDEGLGMDADDLDRIAKPFTQGRNSTGRHGTGLGLATVKMLTEAHGGSVKVATAPGRGTIVTVSLPRADLAHARAAE